MKKSGTERLNSSMRKFSAQKWKTSNSKSKFRTWS